MTTGCTANLYFTPYLHCALLACGRPPGRNTKSGRTFTKDPDGRFTLHGAEVMLVVAERRVDLRRRT